MGTYTEIIFGAALKKDTPKKIIDTLRFVANGRIDSEENMTSDDPIVVVDNNIIDEYDLYKVIRCASYYYAVSTPVSKMWYDKIANHWILSFRSNCKNYDSSLEHFLDWIEPYIKDGSGEDTVYAIIMYEEGLPKIYSLREQYKVVRDNV